MLKSEVLLEYIPLALAAGMSGLAAAPAPEQVPSAIAVASDPERMVCRRVEETGSRLKAQRVCMTKAQWEEQRRQNRLSIERSQAQIRVENPEG